MSNLNYLLYWIRGGIIAALDEKYFLYVIGSIFLLGVAGKVIVRVNYKKLVKSAETINKADNSVLRQIKMRIDSVKEVNGIIASPEALIERQLNRCHIFKISINALNEGIHWCTMLMLFWSTLSFATGNGLTNMVAGGGFALVLEWLNLCMGTERLRDELKTILVDYIENNSIEKKRQLEETLNETTAAEEKSRQQEVVLNQVIGEYLQ